MKEQTFSLAIRKQKPFYRLIIRSFLYSLFALLTVPTEVSAQITKTFSYKGTAEDYVVPSSTQSGEVILLTAGGGSGGVWRHKNAFTDSKYPAGGGASVIAAFKVGNGENEIAPGDILRFMVGGAGESITSDGAGGAGGGGGTGIAVKHNGVWKLLMVAGGGAGSGYAIIWGKSRGGSGKAYREGNEGNGYGGKSTTAGGGGGGAYKGDYDLNNDGEYEYGRHANAGWYQGPSNGEPTGSAKTNLGPFGGWGFGSGGDGARDNCAVGGGGGFSGGATGGGDSTDPVGGTSYVDESTIEYKSWDGNSTTDNKEGYASLKIIDSDQLISLNDTKVASIRPRIHQSHCIDNAGGKTTNGNKIQLWNCGGAEGNNNQKWFFDDGYSIRLSNHRGMCLDLPSTSNGTNLQLYACNGSASQAWIYDAFDQVIRFQSNLNKCIDLTNGGTANGTVVQIWDCQTDNSNMQWTLEQATPNPEDEVFGAINLTSSPDSDKKCIDLKDGNISNGANIQLWPCDGDIAQTWYVEGDQIRIDGRADYCLSLKSGDAHNGDDVHIWECKDQDNQAWIFDMTFKLIRSRIDANKCLTVINDDIKLATCSFNSTILPNQQWTLPGGYSERINGKNLKMHLGKDDNKCIDMANASSGADVRVYDCKNGSDAAAQTFYFDGSRIRRADNHLLCLELEGAKTDVGTDIQLGTCTGSIFSQKWMYDGISGRIHSKADPNKCMDFDHASTANGTNLKLDDCKVHDAQIFDIK